MIQQIRMLAVALAGMLAFLPADDAKASQICDTVQVGMTPGGGPILQQQCYWVYGAVAIDPVTRGISAAWNQPSPEAARDHVLDQCGGCVYISFAEDFAWIALSDDGRSYGTSTSGPRDAEARCEGAYGSRCFTVVAASSTADARFWPFASIAYDPASGASGVSWQAVRWTDAEALALRECGAASCWAFTFQTGYAAIARGPGTELYGNWSAKNEKDAAKRAVKDCEKKHGKKTCKVVVTGSAFSAPQYEG